MKMTKEQFFNVISKGENRFLLDSIVAAELTPNEILQFDKAYREYFFDCIDGWGVVELILERFEIPTVEDIFFHLPHGLLYLLGEKGIEEVKIDKENIFNYVRDEIQVNQLTGEYYDVLSDISYAYALSKLCEDYDIAAKGNTMHEEKYKEAIREYIDEFYKKIIIKTS